MGLLRRLLSPPIEPLFKGRRKQGCKKTMARPEGAQALRAIQEALDPSHIGEGLVRVDASFSSFLRAEEKDRPFWFFSKRTQGNALKKGII